MELDWPGWELKNNPHGEEFDAEARMRMIRGSEKLLLLLDKYKERLGDLLLELGPFFHPLLNPQRFAGKKIFYWDNDHHVLDYLREKHQKENTVSLYCDLDEIKEHSNRLAQACPGKFDSIVASHILNYIDYKPLLHEARRFLKKGGLFFINNSIDYGLPSFFSPQRPKSNEEILTVLRQLGFKIVEKMEIESENKRYQPNSRLLLAAQK